jgi:hypothetical protein
MTYNKRRSVLSNCLIGVLCIVKSGIVKSWYDSNYLRAFAHDKYIILYTKHEVQVLCVIVQPQQWGDN